MVKDAQYYMAPDQYREEVEHLVRICNVDSQDPSMTWVEDPRGLELRKVPTTLLRKASIEEVNAHYAIYKKKIEKKERKKAEEQIYAGTY